ncbi:hypothetical protein HK097_004861, partial [Rhizophlyctis rosea]
MDMTSSDPIPSEALITAAVSGDLEVTHFDQTARVAKAAQDLLTAISDFLRKLGVDLPSQPQLPTPLPHDLTVSQHAFVTTVRDIAKQYKLLDLAPELGRKRKFDDLEPPTDNQAAKPVRLEPGLVQMTGSKSEVTEKIDTFIQTKRGKIDESNRQEFTKPRFEDTTCARIDAADLNRTIQMKLNVVHNVSGPLERSTHRDASSNGVTTRKGDSGVPFGVEERLKNVQRHLNVEFVSATPLPIYTRLKALEDRLIQLEEYSPAWAAFHFDQPNRETSDNSVLREPPPVTVVTADAEGRVVSSVVP